MSYSDIVATIAMIVSITAVPASGYFSYHFAIKGEKRKEFNAISDVIRQKLREQLLRMEYFPVAEMYQYHSERLIRSLISASPKTRNTFRTSGVNISAPCKTGLMTVTR